MPKITFAATATAKSGHVEYPLGTVIDFTTSRWNDGDISAKKATDNIGLKALVKHFTISHNYRRFLTCTANREVI